MLALPPANVAAVIGRAHRNATSRPLRSAPLRRGWSVAITDGYTTETVWDFAREPLIGCGQLQFEKDGGARMKPRLHSSRSSLTNPRGGVVHTLRARRRTLCRLGYDATVLAPDTSGTGFFRETLCCTVSVAASRVGRDVTAMVETRVADYIRHLERPVHRGFDVWLRPGLAYPAMRWRRSRARPDRELRHCFHVDGFADPRLTALQVRAIAADRLFAVSRLCRWAGSPGEFDRVPHLIGNGVDMERILGGRGCDRCIVAGPAESCRRARFSRHRGVETRKNTSSHPRRAFHHRVPRLPSVGVSPSRAAPRCSTTMPTRPTLRRRWRRVAAGQRHDPRSPGQPGHRAAPCRAADVMVFPGRPRKGFGLVVLEAMASGDCRW